MTEQKIGQLEKDIAEVKSDVGSLKGEVVSFKDGMANTLDKLSVSIHELAIAVSESKFRDENLKAYVEQNHKHVEEKLSTLHINVEGIKRYNEITKEDISTIKTQQALNNRSIADARGIFLKVVGGVVLAGVLIWFGLK
jgi:chromosome segregation ATPase